MYRWARDGDTDWDIAWITLNTAVGYTSGWKGIRTAFYSPGTIVNNAGYGGDCAPGADCSDHMRTMGCEIYSEKCTVRMCLELKSPFRKEPCASCEGQ